MSPRHPLGGYTTDVSAKKRDQKTLEKAIKHLRSARGHGRYLVIDGRNRWRYPKEFTQKQIIETLQLTPEEVAQHFPPPFVNQFPLCTKEVLIKQVRKFLKEEGRWPAAKDFSRDPRLTSRHRMRQLYQWHRIDGVWVTPLMGLYHDVVRKYKLTPEEIFGITNLTLRRDAIEKYGGIEKLVSFGELRQQDDFGKLWVLPGESKAEPMVMLEVVNSTQNPDGTYDHYCLRVPPTMQRAQAAVAWTFPGTDEKTLEFAAQS